MHWIFVAAHGLSLVAIRRLVIEVSSLVEHDLRVHGLSNCSAWALLLYSMWVLPGPGIEPISPALTGRCLTSGPPGKSHLFLKHDKTFNKAALRTPL